MPARSLPTLLALLVALGLSAACGDGPEPADAPVVSDASHWPIHEDRDANVQVGLPDARFDVPDPDGGPPRLVVNVLASGDVMLKNHTWRPSSGDEAARAASLEGLRTQLEELTVAARKRGGDEGTPLPVLLYADREASWRAIRDVLTILREPVVGTQRLQWAVQTADPAGVSGRVDGALGPAPEAHAAPLVLRIVADRGEAWTVVRIFGPTGIHSFGPQATGSPTKRSCARPTPRGTTSSAGSRRWRRSTRRHTSRSRTPRRTSGSPTS